MINEQKQRVITPWQVVMLFLSIYVLIALFVGTIFHLPNEISDLLNIVDTAICLVFIADFFYQLSTAPKKLAYLKWGWIDLVSSIPNVSFLRIGRLVRIARIFRLLRGVRSVKLIVSYLFVNRARGTLQQLQS
jgi:voltage-gated potassium channel